MKVLGGIFNYIIVMMTRSRLLLAIENRVGPWEMVDSMSFAMTGGLYKPAGVLSLKWST